MFVKYQFFAALSVIAVVVTVAEGNNCTGANQEWPQGDCYNRCTRTCGYYNGNTVCTKDCQPKQCDCKKGYYRNSYDQCVKQDVCAKCKNPNEEWPQTSCFNACTRTCNAHNGKQACTRNCQPKQCDCVKDYYRDSNGNCISKAECEQCTGDNEEYKQCYNTCATSCRTAITKGVCNLACRLGGCDCQKGFYRDPYNYKCVRKCDCPQYCNQCGNCTNTNN